MAGYYTTQFWILCYILVVGCDGVLGSGKLTDKCGVCEGNNSTCHIISGIFTRVSLPYGYNRVTTIPSGACNINVTEMHPSNNYMAIKYTRGRYVLNGNWALGYSNSYEGAGTTFQYNRANPSNELHPLESIIAPGPTNSSIDIMMIKQSNNRGILYSYTIPTASATSTGHRHRNHHRQHHRGSHHHQNDNAPKYLSKADDVLDNNNDDDDKDRGGDKQQSDFAAHRTGSRITHKIEPVRLDDKAAQSEADPQQPQRDAQTDYEERYRDYLEKLRRQQEDQRSLRTEQRRQREEEARQDRERLEEERAQEARRKQQEEEAEAKRQEKLRDYARNTGFQATGKQYENVYRNFRPGVPSPGVATGAAITSQRGAVPLQSPPTQYQAQNRQIIPATNYGYPLSNGNAYNPPSAVVPSRGSSPNRYPLLPSNYPSNVAGQRTYPLTASNSGSASYPIPRASALRAYPVPAAIGPQRQPQPQAQPQQPRVISAYKPGYHAEFPAQNSRGVSQVFPGQQPLSQPGGFPVLGRQPSPYRLQGDGYPYSVPGRTLNDQVAALSLPRGPSSLLGSTGASSGVQLGVFQGGSGDYGWKISGFTDCSATCGGGSQNTVVVCVRLSTQTVVTDSNCINAIKPKVQAVACNNLACPPDWEPGVWGSCSTTCDPGRQTRQVSCKQRLSASLSLDVAGNECDLNTKPVTVQRCNDEKLCVDWKIGEWGQCSAECGRGQRSREVVCMTAEGRVTAENKCRTSRPITAEICDMGSCAKTWFFTEWSEECSTECGDGVYSRNIHCSAEASRCSSITKPSQSSPCKNDIPCGGHWFTGPWSKCDVPCGEGLTERAVVCMKKLGGLMAVVSEENCLLGEKPLTQQVCQRDPCLPQWYMTEWAECSRSCGGGISTREVKCLNSLQQPSTRCPPDDKPLDRQACNTYRCPDRNAPDTQQHQGCADKFKNCRVIVQARLCRFDYYKEVCCFSCSKRHHSHRRHTGSKAEAT